MVHRVVEKNATCQIIAKCSSLGGVWVLWQSRAGPQGTEQGQVKAPSRDKRSCCICASAVDAGTKLKPKKLEGNVLREKERERL